MIKDPTQDFVDPLTKTQTLLDPRRHASDLFLVQSCPYPKPNSFPNPLPDSDLNKPNPHPVPVHTRDKDARGILTRPLLWRKDTLTQLIQPLTPGFREPESIAIYGYPIPAVSEAETTESATGGQAERKPEQIPNPMPTRKNGTHRASRIEAGKRADNTWPFFRGFTGIRRADKC